MKTLICLLLLCASAFASPRWSAGGMLREFLGPLMPQYVATAFTRGVAPVGSYTLTAKSPTTLGTCASGTSCAVTLAASISTGDLVTVSCMLPVAGSVMMNSVSSGGTLFPLYSASGTGDGNIGNWTNGYFIATGTVSGSITINYVATTGSTSECFVRDYGVSSGTPLLDWASASIPTASGASTSGLTPVLSTTKAAIVQQFQGESGFSTRRLTSSVSTYGNGQIDSTNGPGVADLLNTTSTTAPTWTITAGTLGFADKTGMAFGTDATACQDVMFADWSGSTSGTTPTASLANASSFGYPQTGHTSIQANGWTANTASAMSYQTATPPALHHSIKTCGDGATHSGSTSFAMQYDQSTATVGYLGFGFMGGLTSSMGMQIYTTYAGTDTNFHDEAGVGSTTNNFVTLQVGGSGSATQLRIECNGGGGTTNFSSGITVSTSTWYWVSIQNASSTGGSIEVCSDDTCGTVVGTGTCTASGWTSRWHDTFQVGQGGGTSDFPATVFRTANVIFDGHGVYPVTTAIP